jgi:hypothetical protein
LRLRDCLASSAYTNKKNDEKLGQQPLRLRDCLASMTVASIMLIAKEFDKLLGINKHKNKNKIKTCGEVYADSAYANKKNKTIFIGVDMHFIAIGGFSFPISGYFDIIVGFRILSVVGDRTNTIQSLYLQNRCGKIFQ